MLRFLGTYSRTIVSSYPSATNTLLRSIRPISNYQKIAETQASDDKVRQSWIGNILLNRSLFYLVSITSTSIICET